MINSLSVLIKSMEINEKIKIDDSNFTEIYISRKRWYWEVLVYHTHWIEGRVCTERTKKVCEHILEIEDIIDENYSPLNINVCWVNFGSKSLKKGVKND